MRYEVRVLVEAASPTKAVAKVIQPGSTKKAWVTESHVHTTDLTANGAEFEIAVPAKGGDSRTKNPK